MDQAAPHELIVPETLAGQRLDSAMATLLPDYSRSRLQEWIRAGCVLLDDVVPSTRQRLIGGERLVLRVPEENLTNMAEPEAVPLDVVYEDEHLVVINKTANLVMHPAAGNWSGTVLNGLLHRYPEVSVIPRAGIVHRLDKDTTGLFVVARSLLAHTSLVDQLQTRTMGREYTAIVEGTLVSGGTVDEPIGRHPKDRKKMAISHNGKHAVTHYRLAEKFLGHTCVSVKLETGRTHQIRVHMSALHHPLIGDSTYGRRRFPKGLTESARQEVHDFPRQALHAHKLSLMHPATREDVSWEVPLPNDMLALLAALRQTA